MAEATARQGRTFQFIDVSGVGNSGKTAVVDLLREIDGVFAPPYWFEFDFIRIPNGLLDLRHRVLEDWSPVRSHFGVKAFIRAAEMMGLDPAWWNLRGLLLSTSQRYDRYFAGDFVRLSRQFANDLVRGAYVAEWPYDDLQLSGRGRFVRKALYKLGQRDALRRHVLLADAPDFDERATAYVNALFAPVADDADAVVLNNGFEPFDPVPGLEMIQRSYQIVVTRDPRDVYVSGLNRHNVGGQDRNLLPFDNDGMNKSFLATDDLTQFILRQKVYHAHLYKGDDTRVMRVRFEDLCLRYEDTVAGILAFLRCDSVRHRAPKTCFVPEKSSENVGVWRRYSKQSEIDEIARCLPGLLVEG